MPFQRHLRVTALGSLGSGADRFSYGVNLQVIGPVGGPVPDADVASIAATVKAFHTRPTSSINSAAVLDTVKLAIISPSGEYESDAVSVAITGGAGAAAGSSNVLPQSALAISLMTDRRGPSGMGRFYIPMPSVGVIAANGFQIELDNATSILNSAKTFLDALPEPLVASTKGFNTPVTGVRVGRVIDTIRSRRNALAENYTPTLPVT